MGDIHAIRANVADRFIQKRVHAPDAELGKHKANAEKLMNDIREKMHKGEDVRTHIAALQKTADMHSRLMAGTSNSKYSGRESHIKDAKNALALAGSTGDQDSLYGRQDSKSQGLRRAKEYLRKAHTGAE